MEYKKTLNMPKSGFPMRAGLPKREPEMLRYWEQLDLYNELLKKNEGKPLFSLHDGPPFSNGALHMGHALNKALKDFINRSYAMRGYYTPYIPGWDNHGMPIESAIIKQNKLNHKAMSVAEFRSACHQFADHYIDVQREGFKRMGVVADWEHPYKTMDPGFEAREVRVFGQMYKNGHIYKGLKPVYWCPHDETALAEAEIEYAEDPCKSIYVKFKVKDDHGKLGKYCDLDKLYFIIWTTTTWTIPGNLAICLNADFDYVLAKAPNGEVYIVAKELMGRVAEMGGYEGFEVLAEMKGSEFEFMTAQHPLIDRESVVILGDHVTLDAGTGCVHTAPGHGQEDYEICRKYDAEGKIHIGMTVPVDDHGLMNEEAGKYCGLTTDQANEAIFNDLQACGALYASEDIIHQYAHCWRCKSPILYRATDQWFCSVDAFKDQACAACDDVQWLPEWGHDRMIAMIRERADWCISRQRRWGLPIPVFYCSDCGKPVCTDETIKAVSDIFREKGSNAWFEMDAAELLPEGFTCPHCGGRHFTKETDTLDGWFDSGSTHIASMELDSPGRWPAEMYLEGGDQFRGWFQSSLLIGVATKGKAPYKTCLCHGWTVDGEGKAMHKSLGNGVDPADIFNENGADILRLWAASADYHADVRCSKEIFKQLSQNYLKFRNTCKFMLDNLVDFDPEKLTKPEEMPKLDRWLLTKLNELIEKAEQSYCDYEFHIITHAVNDFCVTTLSSFYLDIVKDRLYCDGADSLSRRSAQTALYLTLHTLSKLFAPILAFTCDEIWLAMPHTGEDDARNVVLNEMNKPFAAYALTESEMADWEKLVDVRTAVNGVLEAARAEKKIGKSLEADVHLTVPAEDAFLANMDGKELADLLIVSQVEVTVGEGVKASAEEAAGTKCPRCWKHSTAANAEGLCPRCAEVMAKFPDLA